MAKNQKNKRSMKRWSAGEDEKLATNVMNHTNNLKHAFQITSVELQRTPGAVAARWYMYVSKDPDYTAFVKVARNQMTVNRNRGKGIPTKTSLFKRIMKILGLRCNL